VLLEGSKSSGVSLSATDGDLECGEWLRVLLG
jgi:hypothetical protein